MIYLEKVRAAIFSRLGSLAFLSGNVTLLCSLLAFFAATMIPLDVLVRGNGVIRVEGHNVDIQHPDGGMIAELRVTSGQSVKAGEILATIVNPTLIEDLHRSKITVKALELREERLSAEIEDKDFEPKSDNEPEISEIISSERALFSSRRASLQESIEIAKNQFLQKEAQITELRSHIEDTGREMQFVGEHVRLLEPMVAKGAAAEVQLVQRRLEYQRVVSSINEAKARLPRIISEKEEMKLRMERFRTEFVADASKSLSQVQIELPQARAKLLASKTRMDNSTIISPVDGVIQRVMMPHTGAVIKPGEKVFEIAPSSVPLVADVKIRPQDRDRIWVGMDARLRLAAYGGYRSTLLEGKISVISADTLGDDEKGRYYELKVTILSIPEGTKIYPGMAVEAFMVVGSRTFAQYLFKPFVDGFAVVFSE